MCPGVAHCLEITSQGPTSIEKASSESVKLDCQFSLAPEDSGPLDIEWSLLASDNQKEDKVVSGWFICGPSKWFVCGGVFIPEKVFGLIPALICQKSCSVRTSQCYPLLQQKCYASLSVVSEAATGTG